MAVYLGTSGVVQFARSSEGYFRSMLDPGDVNDGENRFSFDFPNGTFLSGDRLTITRINPDGTRSPDPLDFVDPSGWGDGNRHPDGAWYVHVDTLGGLRLYRSWGEALSGSGSTAIPLNPPSGSYLISVEPEDAPMNCLGQILDYSLTTQRGSIDVTSLGDAFAESVSGLISGGGSIQCLWDWRPSACGIGAVETAHYFHQLVLRQQLGSEFHANFFIKQDGARPEDEELPSLAMRTALFYDAKCIVTNVAMAFSPTDALRTTIQFATTGEIQLRYGLPSAYLILQEDSSKISLEDDRGFLAQETDT